MWDVCCANSCCLISQNGNTCSRKTWQWFVLICGHSEKIPGIHYFLPMLVGIKFYLSIPSAHEPVFGHYACCHSINNNCFPIPNTSKTLKLTICSPKKRQYLGTSYLVRMCRDRVSSDPKIPNYRPCHHWKKNSKKFPDWKVYLHFATMELPPADKDVWVDWKLQSLPGSQPWLGKVYHFINGSENLKMNFRMLQKTASRRDVFTWKDSNCRAGRKKAQVITTVFTVCSLRLQLRLCFILLLCLFLVWFRQIYGLHCFSTSIHPPVCCFLELGSVNRRWRPHVRALMLSSLVL